MSDEKKTTLLDAIKDKDDFYNLHRPKIQDALKHAHKVLSEKERIGLYAKLFEKEGLEKSYVSEDIGILQKAYVKSFRHLKDDNVLPFLFAFGFDKKDELPVGKTAESLSLKEFVEIIDRSTFKDIPSVLKRKQYFAELAKKNAIPARILDCMRHLGFLDVKHPRAHKGGVDTQLFFPFLYILLLNKKTKSVMEKQIKANTFHYPGKENHAEALQILFKETGLTAPP